MRGPEFAARYVFAAVRTTLGAPGNRSALPSTLGRVFRW
jgi:hypothetical protein